MAISTGAVVPEGADAVAPVEIVVQNDNSVEISQATRSGANVRPRGGDIAAGEVVIPAGTRLSPGRLAAVAASGIAVAFSTHDPDHVFLCGDRVALLHDGGMEEIGTPEAVITAAALKRLYGVEVQVVDLPDHETRTCVPSVHGLRRRGT